MTRIIMMGSGGGRRPGSQAGLWSRMPGLPVGLRRALGPLAQRPRQCRPGTVRGPARHAPGRGPVTVVAAAADRDS